MKSFKQFIKAGKFKSEFDHGINGYTHTQDLQHPSGKTKNVTTHFYNPDDDPNHYGVIYTVNNNLSKGGKPFKQPDDDNDDLGFDAGVLKHVHEVTNRFIKKKKPKSVEFVASDYDPVIREKKHKLYSMAASRLAKDHGGTPDYNEETGRFTIHFNRKNQQ